MSRGAASLVLIALIVPATAAAQQPWVDAGQQAMIQHYNNLIEQQSTPDQEDEVEQVRRRGANAQQAPDERCDREAVKAKLQPEYERRLQADGAAAAGAWLREQGEEAGRYAARNC